MSCLWTLKLSFSFCEVHHLFHCLSFQIVSIVQPASYPNGTRKSFLGTTIARGCIKPLTFSYCLGLECVGKFTPMSFQCYCGVVLMHRDNFIFHCYKTIASYNHDNFVNVRLYKTPVINKVIMVTTSNIHVNRLAGHLAGNKRNTVDGEAYIFKGEV